MAHKFPVITVLTNSYISLSTAEDYFTERANHTVWDNASPEVQLQMIITTSRLISLQAKDAFKLGTIATVPVLLQQATCELVLSALTSADVVDQSDTSKNIKIVKAGSVQVEFFRPTAGARFPSTVMNMLKAADVLDSTFTSFGFANGNASTSTFDDCNSYDRNRGFF